MRPWTIILAVLSAALLLLGVAAAFFIAPETVVIVGGQAMGRFSQKIFYYHVPVAETSLIAFYAGAVIGGLFLASLTLRETPATGSLSDRIKAFLAKRKRELDVLSYSSIELAFVFGLLVEWTGIIWTRSEWGKWWEWEPRLTTYLIVLLMGAAYFVLRSSIREEAARARYSAVYTVVLAVAATFTLVAPRLLPEAPHPEVFFSGGGGLEPPMLLAFLVSMFGMLLLYVVLLVTRARVHLARDEVERLKDLVGG